MTDLPPIPSTKATVNEEDPHARGERLPIKRANLAPSFSLREPVPSAVPSYLSRQRASRELDMSPDTFDSYRKRP